MEHKVIYVAHTKMPLNLNIWEIFAKKLTQDQINKIIENAVTELKIICKDISNGIIKDFEYCPFMPSYDINGTNYLFIAWN